MSGGHQARALGEGDRWASCLHREAQGRGASPLTFRAACITLTLVKNGEEDFPTRRITDAPRCNHRHAWRIILPRDPLDGVGHARGSGERRGADRRDGRCLVPCRTRTGVLTVDAAAYDAWYDTARGAWIGTTEFRLLSRLLQGRPGDTLLDVGCGTGWFTRHFAEEGLLATGLDPNLDWLAFARAHSPPAVRWVAGDARALPFPDHSFDRVISVAALCFVEDERQAVTEIVRVARRRFAIGWLNRTSLLYAQKGRSGGRGAYHGARWHRPDDLLHVFSGLAVRRLTVRSAIFLPGGDRMARTLERLLPHTLPWGGLVVVAGERDDGS